MSDKETRKVGETTSHAEESKGQKRSDLRCGLKPRWRAVCLEQETWKPHKEARNYTASGVGRRLSNKTPVPDPHLRSKQLCLYLLHLLGLWLEFRECSVAETA